MAKLVLTDVTNILGNPTSAANTLNNNSAQIEAALENTLSRDGTIPNQMLADFDMNNYDILNVDTLGVNTLLIDGEIVQPGEVTNALLISNALSELSDAGLSDEARDNLGLGSAATQPSSAFATAAQGAKADLAVQFVATRTDMAALPTTLTASFLREAGREGSFTLVDYSAFSTLVDTDTAQALFVRSTQNTSKAWMRVFNGPMRDTWAGVVRYPTASSQPSAVNSSAAFNAGLKIAKACGIQFGFTAGDAYVSHTVAGDVSNAGYAILNEGVSIVGLVSRAADSCIRPLTTMSQYATYISLRPPASSDLSGVSYKNFMILTYNSGFSGTKYGKKVFDQLVTSLCNISNLVLEDLYFGPGNDYSVYLYNDKTINPQGVPANTTINRCLFFEGSDLLNVGDSIRYRDCVLRSTSGSLRTGVRLYQVDTVGGGVAGCFVMDNVNSDCDGGTLLMLRGRNPVVINCNIEQSHGPGTVNGAVLDFDGSSGRIARPTARDNAIGLFGTATADYAIRFNGATGGGEFNNTIVSDFKPGSLPRAAAFLVTVSADNVTIGSGNVDPTTFTTVISDAGGGTRGVARLLTLVNGFANLGMGYASGGFYKDAEGRVHLEGFLTTPVNPNGITLATLPSGFRPLAGFRVPAYGLVSAASQTIWVEILADGLVKLICPAGVTQVDLSGVFFTTNSKVPSVF